MEAYLCYKDRRAFARGGVEGARGVSLSDVQASLPEQVRGCPLL
jgi:hypothetical protein